MRGNFNSKIIDLTGRRYGMLTVLGLSHLGIKWRETHWSVRCECGTEKTMQRSNLTNPLNKSCGCFKRVHCQRVHPLRIASQMAAADRRFSAILLRGSKVCSNPSCPIPGEQSLGNFAPQNKTRDGRDTRCKECRKRSAIQRKYGVSNAEKERRIAAQHGRCANLGCGTDITGPRRAHIDHNHETGQVRGILCGKCNRALGMLGESRVRIEFLATYLVGWQLEAKRSA